jgi:hypothetical protein
MLYFPGLIALDEGAIAHKSLASIEIYSKTTENA